MIKINVRGQIDDENTTHCNQILHGPGRSQGSKGKLGFSYVKRQCLYIILIVNQALKVKSHAILLV
mgnify:FL=1